MSLGSLSLKRRFSTFDHNATNIVDNNNLVQRKGKNLVANLMQVVQYMMGWWVENVIHFEVI